MNDMGYIVKWLPITGILPTQGTPGSAGWDLYASQHGILTPGQILAVPLGFSTEFSPDLHFRIESRSGLALKGIVVLTGVIDSDYRGEWKVILKNFTQENFLISPGDRIAQAVARPTIGVDFRLVGELSESSRGAGGFGSTGTK